MTCPAMFLCLLQEVVLSMLQFDLIACEKRCHREQIFAKREKFFNRALRSVNHFLSLKIVSERTAHIDKLF